MGQTFIFLGILIFSAHVFSAIFSRKKIPDVLLLMLIGIVTLLIGIVKFFKTRNLKRAIESSNIAFPEIEKIKFEKKCYSTQTLVDEILNSSNIDCEKWLMINNCNKLFKVEDEKLFVLYNYFNYKDKKGIDTVISINSLIVDMSGTFSIFCVPTLCVSSSILKIIYLSSATVLLANATMSFIMSAYFSLS